MDNRSKTSIKIAVVNAVRKNRKEWLKKAVKFWENELQQEDKEKIKRFKTEMSK